MILQIGEVSSQVYRQHVFPKLIFDTVEFNELNRYKVKKVHYYLFGEKKKYFALSLGEGNDKDFYNPYSAPFASWVNLRKNWTLEQLEEAVKAFDRFAHDHMKCVRFTFPPEFYEPKMIAGLLNVLLRYGYSISWQDLNYAIDLHQCDEHKYIQQIRQNARKNLRQALSHGLSLVPCIDLEMKKEAYRIIAVNREERGYPLRMSWDQVRETIGIVAHEFFLVKYKDISVAAAIVFHVTDEIAQVIYWGNILEYNSLRSINYLAFQLVEFYKAKGFHYLDIGPSSEKGSLNYGLCDFKDSIGCFASSKFVLNKIF